MTLFAAQHIFNTDNRQSAGAFELLLREHNGQSIDSILSNPGLLTQELIPLMLAKAKTIRHLMVNHPLHQYFINISPGQAASHKFIDSLKVFADNQVPTSSVSLEITEHWFGVDRSCALENIQLARQLGFSIIVDDFGAAGIHLSNLAAIRPSVVKLDISLLKNAELNALHRKLLISTVRMLHEIGTKVVAEGVETAELFKIARHAQVDYVQGYLFDKPTIVDLAS